MSQERKGSKRNTTSSSIPRVMHKTEKLANSEAVDEKCDWEDTQPFEDREKTAYDLKAKKAATREHMTTTG